jgi:hypothetical protein
MLKNFLLQLLKPAITQLIQDHTADLRREVHTLTTRSAEREKEQSDMLKAVLEMMKEQSTDNKPTN